MGQAILNWEKLMSCARVLVCDAHEAKNKVSLKVFKRDFADIRSPFERDYCHVIFSSPFRRLGRKTQVHPFPVVDYVRCRLTHSLEVSTIAASLIKNVYAMFVRENGVVPFNLEDASWILRTAGLAHDLGNPPYGHAGERGIRDWTETQRAFETEAIRRDFSYYDGNAESFHILSRNDLRPGLYNRLTAACLGAIVKYPYFSDKATVDHPKFGAFNIDRGVFDAVMVELGLKQNGEYLRHPLSFLLEAADDISYNLSDLEDGVKMDAVDRSRVIDLLLELLPAGIEQKDKKIKKDWGRKKSICELRSASAGQLISEYAKVFFLNYEDIMRGAFRSGDDFETQLPDEIKNWLKKSKNVRREIYNDDRIVKAEKEGRQAVSALLSKYMDFLKYVDTNRVISEENRENVLRVLGDNFLECRGDRPKEWWRHVILDYIVGMTDDYMKNEHMS